MPPNLIRVTFDRHDPGSLNVEYGRTSLIPLEELEMQRLAAELKEYSSFTATEKASPAKMRELEVKKKRYDELERISNGADTVWETQPISAVESVLLIITPDARTVYVENIPEELIQKMLMDQPVIVNVTQGPAPAYLHMPLQVEDQPQLPSGSLELVKQAIGNIQETPTMAANKDQPWVAMRSSDGKYHGLVYVSEIDPSGAVSVPGVVYAWPVKFMKDDWNPVNNALKDAFGENLEWVTAKKYSHWRISA